MLRRAVQLLRSALDRTPAAMVERARVKFLGDLRDKERHGMLERAQYAYGLLRAADLAKFSGKSKTTVCEFGVAQGHGLLNMIALAEQISEVTKVGFRIVGFDTGEGLPPIDGYKDHAELWSPGDFPTLDRKQLVDQIRGRAEILWGDIAGTVGGFMNSLTPDAPLGFVSIDVDVYTATKSALKCLAGPADLYLPAVSMYFDDVSFFFANPWCGELRAIEEFDAENELRKIDRDRSLPKNRADPRAFWYEKMYACHILDHPLRNRPRARQGLTLDAHGAFMEDSRLF